jgi:hypothetical protein
MPNCRINIAILKEILNDILVSICTSKTPNLTASAELQPHPPGQGHFEIQPDFQNNICLFPSGSKSIIHQQNPVIRESDEGQYAIPIGLKFLFRRWAGFAGGEKEENEDNTHFFVFADSFPLRSTVVASRNNICIF